MGFRSKAFNHYKRKWGRYLYVIGLIPVIVVATVIISIQLAKTTRMSPAPIAPKPVIKSIDLDQRQVKKGPIDSNNMVITNPQALRVRKSARLRRMVPKEISLPDIPEDPIDPSRSYRRPSGPSSD